MMNIFVTSMYLEGNMYEATKNLMLGGGKLLVLVGFHREYKRVG